MSYHIDQSVFRHELIDQNAGFARDCLKDAVKQLISCGVWRDTIISVLTSEILALHTANPFRDPVDEAALVADLRSIRPVQNRINGLVEWLEQGIARGEQAQADAARDAEFP
jgi:hypothetical protein